MMWGWDGWGGWGWGGIVMIILMILFWAAVIVGIVLVVRALTSDRSRSVGQSPGRMEASATTDGALRILEERYARGEIDREEFLRRKEDLVTGQGQ